MTALLRRLGKNLSWLVVGNAVTRGAMLLVMAIAALTLGPAPVGVLTIGLGAAMVAVPLFALGQVEVLIRESAKHPHRIPALSQAARRDRYRTFAAGVPVVLAGIFFINEPALRALLFSLLPFVIFRVEASIRVAYFTGLDRMEVGTQTRAVEAAIGLGLVLLAGLSGLPVWTLGLALGVGAGASLLWVRHKTRELPGTRDATPFGSLLPESIPFLGQGVVLQLLLRSDAFLLAAFAVSKESIGHYGAATAVVWGLLALPQLAGTALYPTLSRRARDRRQPTRSAGVTALAGLGIGAAAAGAVWLVRDPLVGLVFGEEFLPTVPVLELLLWALPPAAASMVLGINVAAWRRQLLGLIVLLIALVVFVSLSLIWIPGEGLFGAARAAIVAHWMELFGMFGIAAWPLRGEVEAPRTSGD